MIILYLVILAALFFFLIVRPQRRQAMLRRQLIATVREGDEIVTSGGVLGRVVRIDDEVLHVEIAPDTVVRIARGAVAQRLTEDAVDGAVEDAGALEDDDIGDQTAEGDGTDGEDDA